MVQLNGSITHGSIKFFAGHKSFLSIFWDIAASTDELNNDLEQHMQMGISLKIDI